MATTRNRFTSTFPRRSEDKPEHRGVPFSLEAEQATLGAILKDFRVQAEVINILPTAEMFHVLKHQIIYESCLRLFEKSEPADVTTVVDEVQKAGQLERVGGRSYLIELADGVATTANVAYYAEIVSKKHALRNIIDVGTEIVKLSHSQEMDVAEMLDYAESKVFAISESRMRKGFARLSDLLPHTFEQMDKFQENDGGLAGLKTGYDELDTMTAGLHNGEFVVIAGRPSMGKSAFALNIAEYVAVERKVPVGVFSLEMSKESLAMRMLCGRARISQHKLRTGKIRENEWRRLTQAAGPLSEAEIYIDDSGALSSLEMRAKARRLKSQRNIGLVIVDYLQMMHSSVRSENRQQEMSVISRSMKELAKELSIPVIACSQLSRQVEQRGVEKRPQLSDLRESGAIEQDADVVMFVYREEYYKRHLDPKDPEYLDIENKAEIIVAKQRNGPTGVARMLFLKDFVRFENSAPSYRLPDEVGPAIDDMGVDDDVSPI